MQSGAFADGSRLPAAYVEDRTREGGAMKNIVIATDGSPSAAEAVAVGLELAQEQGADVTFVHVLPPDTFVGGRPGPTHARPHHVGMDESELALAEAAEAADAAGV